MDITKIDIDNKFIYNNDNPSIPNLTKKQRIQKQNAIIRRKYIKQNRTSKMETKFNTHL